MKSQILQPCVFLCVVSSPDVGYLCPHPWKGHWNPSVPPRHLRIAIGIASCVFPFVLSSSVVLASSRILGRSAGCVDI